MRVVDHVPLLSWQRLKSVGIRVLLVGEDAVMQTAKAICNACSNEWVAVTAASPPFLPLGERCGRCG
jgi:hypothetical protein